MRTVSITVVLGLALACAAGAQISKAELLELVDSGTETPLILTMIERDCIDFEMSAKVVAELAGKLPRQVIQAAIDCGGPPPESRMCKLYRALTGDPLLEDYPVVVTWFDDGLLRLVEVSSGTWLDERGIKGFKKRFKAMGEHTQKHLAALAVVKDLPGVRDVLVDTNSSISSAELAAMQRDAVLDECSQRARVRVTSEPAHATVYIDGENVGLTPRRLELLPGERLLEIQAKNFEVYSEQLLLHRRRVAQRGRRSRTDGELADLQRTFGRGDRRRWLVRGAHTGRGSGRWRVAQRPTGVSSARPLFEKKVGVGRGCSSSARSRVRGSGRRASCFEFEVAGPVSKHWKELASRLEGAELGLLGSALLRS